MKWQKKFSFYRFLKQYCFVFCLLVLLFPVFWQQQQQESSVLACSISLCQNYRLTWENVLPSILLTAFSADKFEPELVLGLFWFFLQQNHFPPVEGVRVLGIDLIIFTCRNISHRSSSLSLWRFSCILVSIWCIKVDLMTTMCPECGDSSASLWRQQMTTVRQPLNMFYSLLQPVRSSQKAWIWDSVRKAPRFKTRFSRVSKKAQELLWILRRTSHTNTGFTSPPHPPRQQPSSSPH